MAIPAAPLPPGSRRAEPPRDWRQQLLDDPSSLEARYGMAQACLAQGDTPAAIAWLSDACRVAPHDTEAASRLGELLRAHGQAAQALDVASRGYASGARDRSTLLSLARALEDVGQLREAADRYREAVLREPGLVEGHVPLALVLCRLGEGRLALAHAQAAVNLAPEDPAALRALASVLRELRDAGEGVAGLEQLVLPAGTLARVLAAVDIRAG